MTRLGTHRVHVADPGAIHDVREDSRGITLHLGSASLGGQAREELRNALRPVSFGAAYKVLDLLIEHVLRSNGASTGRLTFKQKATVATTRPRMLPVPLGGRPEIWDRIAALYRAFQDSRHAVTHRRAQAVSGGGLEIYDDQRRLVETVSGAEIVAFTGAVHALAELVVEADDDGRRLNIVLWHLNQLSERHGLPALPSTDPYAGRRLLQADLEPVDAAVRFSLHKAREAVGAQPPSIWDLELHAEGRKFVGRWEDLPDPDAEFFEFEPGSPPEWLSEEAFSN